MMTRLLAKNILIFIFITTCSFLIYRNGLIDIPRDDHINLIAERALVKSDWDFFWHTLTYTHSSFNRPGDYFLFRPGFYLYHAVLDIFYGHSMLVAGILSVLLHAASVFVLYLLTAHLCGALIGGLCALAFLFQYPGFEMVYWRHINPYLLGLIFFVLGLYWMIRMSEAVHRKSRLLRAVLFFSLANLFHESFFYAWAICGIFLMIIFPKSHAEFLSQKEKRLIFIFPAALYFILGLAEFVIAMPPSLLGPVDNPDFLSLRSVFSNIITFSGLTAAAFLIPVFFDIRFINNFKKAVWDFTALPNELIATFGFIFLFFLLGSFFYLFLCYRDKKESAGHFVSIISIVYLGFMLFGIAAGRMSLRGTDYVKSATYYFYLSSYFLLILSALSIRWLQNRMSAGKYFPQFLPMAAFAFVILWPVPFNYSNLQRTLEPRKNYNNIVSTLTFQIADFMKQNPQYCYAGSFERSFSDLIPNYLLQRHVCVGEEKKALYVFIAQDEKPWLAEWNSNFNTINDLHLSPDEFSMGDNMIFEEFSEIFNDFNDKTAPPVEIPIFLGKKSYEPVGFTVKFENTEAAGLVLAYQDSGNFILTGINENRFYVYIIENGDISKKSVLSYFDHSQDSYSLTVNQIDQNAIMVMLDQNILMVLREIGPIRGRLGYYFRKKGKSETILPLKANVAEIKPGNHRAFTLRPVLRLELPSLKN